MYVRNGLTQSHHLTALVSLSPLRYAVVTFCKLYRPTIFTESCILLRYAFVYFRDRESDVPGSSGCQRLIIGIR